jgi:transcription initiation factor TFIIB
MYNSYCELKIEYSKLNNSVKKRNKKNVKDIWKSFDDENIIEQKSLECLYTNSINKDLCEYCNLILMINEDGFLCCPNKSCGIIYKDIVDHSAEWRYYGADDNQNGDPTRCGMPINPLLKESSFGCKVLNGYTSSYEMQKIRRYTEWQSMPYKEKSLYDEFQRIIIISQNSGIPKKNFRNKNI